MKAFFAVLFICVLLLSVYYISVQNDDAKQAYDAVQEIDAAYVYFETTLAGLEMRVPNIVQGRILAGTEAVYFPSTNGPIPLYSLTSLEITGVYKGDLLLGEQIKIIEPYYIQNRILHTQGNYLPSKVNQEYIFFLAPPLSKDNEALEGVEGAFFVDHHERGRYLVPDDSRVSAESYSRKELSLGDKSIDLYLRLYQDVIDTYLE